jgi:hypothetical protein
MIVAAETGRSVTHGLEVGKLESFHFIEANRKESAALDPEPKGDWHDGAASDGLGELESRIEVADPDAHSRAHGLAAADVQKLEVAAGLGETMPIESNATVAGRRPACVLGSVAGGIGY